MTPGKPTPVGLSSWLEQRTTSAPEALRRRVAEYAGRVPAGSTLAASLASASQAALDRALQHSTGRSAALDLLAADALVTLALLAQAEQSPEHLAAFAEDILQAHRPGS